MPGLIDEGGTTGLAYTTGTGLEWLPTGIGGPLGLIIVNTPAGAMITEASIPMITESGVIMITQS